MFSAGAFPAELPSWFAEAASALAARDSAFAECLAADRRLVVEARPIGFAGLLRIILEQQVSTAAADTLWRRLRARLDPVAPEGFLTLDDLDLRACGLSRQKIGYGRHLAAAILAGDLDLDAVHRLDDDAAVAALTRLKGIGRWSAEVYLLLALERPDIWPCDDLGVILGVQRLKRLDRRPSRAELLGLAEPWRPYRSTATRLIWHHYLAVMEARRKARFGV